MAVIEHFLRNLERITRPQPRRTGFDEQDCVVAPASTLDDVVAQLCQLTYFVEDLRNIIQQHPNFAGAAASLADGEFLTGCSAHPSVREDKQCADRRPDAADPQHATPAGDDAPAPPAGIQSVGVDDPLATAIQRACEDDPNTRVICYITDKYFDRRLTFELTAWQLKGASMMTTEWLSHDAELLWIKSITPIPNQEGPQ